MYLLMQVHNGFKEWDIFWWYSSILDDKFLSNFFNLLIKNHHGFTYWLITQQVQAIN